MPPGPIWVGSKRGALRRETSTGKISGLRRWACTQATHPQTQHPGTETPESRAGAHHRYTQISTHTHTHTHTLTYTHRTTHTHTNTTHRTTHTHTHTPAQHVEERRRRLHEGSAHGSIGVVQRLRAKVRVDELRARADPYVPWSCKTRS